MAKIKVVKIKEDGRVQGKVNVDDIVSDGRYFYKVFEDMGVKKAVLIDLTLGELGKYLGVEIPSDICDVKVEVGNEFRNGNKLYKVSVVRNRVVIDVEEISGFDFVLRKIDSSHVVKIRI